jgi:hypothetical protein
MVVGFVFYFRHFSLSFLKRHAGLLDYYSTTSHNQFLLLLLATCAGTSLVYMVMKVCNESSMYAFLFIL